MLLLLLLLGGSAPYQAGGHYRRVDANNYWRAYFDGDTSTVKLDKVVASTPTAVASAAHTPANAEELRILFQGNRHRVYAGQKLLIDTTDAALNSATIVGLYNNTGTGITYDDAYAEGL